MKRKLKVFSIVGVILIILFIIWILTSVFVRKSYSSKDFVENKAMERFKNDDKLGIDINSSTTKLNSISSQSSEEVQEIQQGEVEGNDKLSSILSVLREEDLKEVFDKIQPTKENTELNTIEVSYTDDYVDLNESQSSYDGVLFNKSLKVVDIIDNYYSVCTYENYQGKHNTIVICDYTDVMFNDVYYAEQSVSVGSYESYLVDFNSAIKLEVEDYTLYFIKG